MLNKLHLSLIFFALSFYASAFCADGYKITSPDTRISVSVWLTPNGEPVYSLAHSGTTVLKQSKLGIVRSDGDFSSTLSLDSVSDVQPVSDKYTLLHGKRLICSYFGNRRVFFLRNDAAQKMEIIFQVSNDGAAFRYYFPGETATPVTIFKEVTSFHFDVSARAFLQPCDDARTGWSYASPSYENYYQMEIPAGTVAPNQAGWVMPALFHVGKYWVSLTETALDTNYCGSRLSQFSPDGEYAIQFPEPQESKSGGPFLPQSKLPWYTPWRIIAVTDNLADLVESTIETDLAAPAQYDVSSWLQPGVSSWSWVILKDSATVYETQHQFIDFAASMHWKYCLIDALWDTQIGYDKVKLLVDYAKTKNVKILLWYNSAGDWNTTPMTPRDKLLTEKTRRAEFRKLKEMDVSGVKVDFFGGDGQSMIRYYIDILKDAAQDSLAVNFHGATFPRGWSRTYPNLVSMEAIRGEEYVTFGQYFADNQPSHCAVIPFTRNLFDPMDFTPVNFSGIPNEKRRTTGGFEIALSVIFTSGIQHIAETPAGMAAQKDFVQQYMSTLPDRWDDVKFIDGYPGKYVVLARKNGDVWYIAGINGENSPRPITLNVPFISTASKGELIGDSDTEKDFVERKINFSKPIQLTLQPYGGFVITTVPR
ncbi:MAG: glycoside hydrolase family 97 catalytic domain-containing protein [Bacteroidota bacterium]